MRGTRYKLQLNKKPTINRFLQKFEVGDTVHIDFLPYGGIPDPKFQGKTGKIISKRGRGYEVTVSDLNATKTITIKSEHMKKGKIGGKSNGNNS